MKRIKNFFRNAWKFISLPSSDPLSGAYAFPPELKQYTLEHWLVIEQPPSQEWIEDIFIKAYDGEDAFKAAKIWCDNFEKVNPSFANSHRAKNLHQV